MSSNLNDVPFNLAASEGRVKSARRLADAQLKRIEDAKGGADEYAIDMLFLLQESVLVFTETHALLERLSPSPEPEPPKLHHEQTSHPAGQDNIGRRKAVTMLSFFAMLAVSAWAIEVLDPSPMEVAASTILSHFRK